MLNSFERRLRAAEPQTETGARGEAVLQGLLDIGDAGTVILECQPHAAPAGVVDDLQMHLTAAAVIQRVACELAGRGDDLGLIDEAESGLDRQHPDLLAHPHNVVRRTVFRGAQSSSSASRFLQPTLNQRHAALDVQRRLHARQRQAEFHQRDRDRRPHADHDRLGVEDARDRGDIVEHAADEAVDDLQARRCRSARLWRRIRRSCCVRSSSSAVASRSCMSTWMVTSNASPSFRIGMRSMVTRPFLGFVMCSPRSPPSS